MEKIYVKIKSINKQKKKEFVYDIGIAGNHNYFANKMLIHNCHHAASKIMYGEITRREFKYKIGLTATIERLDNDHHKLIQWFKYNTFSYDTGEAIDDGVINEFDFINIGINLDIRAREEYDGYTNSIKKILAENNGLKHIRRVGGKPWFTFLGLLNKRKMLVNNYEKKFDVAKEICLKHKNDKILVFNQYNEQTNKMYWHLLDVGIVAATMHSNVEEKTKQQRLDDFRNDKLNILLTTKILDEGYNVPKTDVAVILASDSGSRQLIQRMGRVLRKKDKTSSIYNVYCKDTFEENNVNKRIKFFKGLSSNYKDYYWEGELK
jgi:superfamily II DNA or RNA helicase